MDKPRLDERLKINKQCPDCGSHLVIRANRKNGDQFLGCVRWPECIHTEQIPEYLILEAVGAKKLPGL